MRKVHKIKLDPGMMDSIRNGQMRVQVRWNDRDFQAGDHLELHETVFSGAEMFNDGKPVEFTGQITHCRIMHVLNGVQFGLVSGFVALSIEFLVELKVGV